MKNLFVVIVVFTIFFSSCRNKADKKANTHTHEDGTEHVNHDNSHDVVPEQEVFELESDTLQVKKDTLNSEQQKEHTHSHDDGHEHTH